MVVDAGSVLAGLRRRRGHQLDLVESLVGIDSQWSNTPGVRRKGEEVAQWLQHLEFTADFVPQPEVPTDLRWVAEILAPGVRYETLAPTVVARRVGRGRLAGMPSVLLLGDLDTAFVGGTDGETPFRVEGDRILGTGVADMQSGIVVMLEAITALDAAGDDSPPLEVILSGDEQAGSLGSRHVIAEAAARCPLTFCMECARDGGHLMHGRAHIGVGMLEATGRESHAGTDRANGVSAIRALAEVIPAVDDLTDDRIVVTVTIVAGGRRRSVVPGYAEAVLDLRARDADAWDDLEQQIIRTVSGVAQGSSVHVRTHVHRPGFSPNQRTEWIVSRAVAVAGQIGIALPGSVGSSAAGSSAFAAQAGSTVVDGMGAPGGDLMTPQEHVLADGIAERAAVLAVLLSDGAPVPSSLTAP